MVFLPLATKVYNELATQQKKNNSAPVKVSEVMDPRKHVVYNQTMDFFVICAALMGKNGLTYAIDAIP